MPGNLAIYFKQKNDAISCWKLIQPSILNQVDGILNYKYLINCDEAMYWSYYFHQGFMYAALFQAQPPTSTTIPQIPSESKVQVHQPKEGPQTANFNLNLTADDLLKAGYENNKTPWTEEEDQKLKILRDQKQMDWSQLAKQMPGRNSKMCYSRYRRLENNTKQSWRKKDDEQLISLVEIYGQEWKQISKHFPKRTHKQVKEHYINYLRPDIKKDDWTLEQDLKLIQQINIFGKNWKIIEENFQGRTQNQIKNRFFGRLKRLAQKKALSKQKSLMESKNRRQE